MKCSVTGSSAGLATGLSSRAARMFVRVNRSESVQFCSLCTGSVLGLVCSDLCGSFSKVARSVRYAVLPVPSLFTPTVRSMGVPGVGLSVQQGGGQCLWSVEKPLAVGGRVPRVRVLVPSVEDNRPAFDS